MQSLGQFSFATTNRAFAPRVPAWRISTARSNSPMPDLIPRQGRCPNDCDALASHVGSASNQTATIAVRTAGATSPLSPTQRRCQDCCLSWPATRSGSQGRPRPGRSDASAFVDGAVSGMSHLQALAASAARRLQERAPERVDAGPGSTLPMQRAGAGDRVSAHAPGWLPLAKAKQAQRPSFPCFAGLSETTTAFTS